MTFGPIRIDNDGPVPVESLSRPLLGGRYGVAVIVPHCADVPAAERAAVGAEVAEALRQLADSFAEWGRAAEAPKGLAGAPILQAPATPAKGDAWT